MGFFDIFKKKSNVNGVVKFLSLDKWWLEDLTDCERETILKTYRPMGSGDNSIIEGEIFTNQNPVNFLWGLAGWFSKPDVRALSYKIIAKAESLIDSNTPRLDVHFLYGTKLELKYKDRDSSQNGLEVAIQACEQQISYAQETAKEYQEQYGTSLPRHTGYQQLAIVLEKQKKFEKAISLCEEAKRQGWGGGWENRIERCTKKLNASLNN